MTLVTCVGLAVQDLVFTMDMPVLSGEKNFASGLHAVGGGPAANAAVAVACLGGRATLVSALGRDAIGDEIIMELGTFGVDCGQVRRVDAPSPLSAVIIEQNGDRTIVNRTDPELWSRATPPTPDDLAGSDAVLVDVRWIDGAVAASRIASHLGIPCVVDVDLTDEVVPDELLKTATHLVFSQAAFEQRAWSASEGAVAALARQTGSFVAVTLGSDGVVWSAGGDSSRMKAYPVDAVDTLAAGDVFHGAFALGVAHGRDADDIVRWSSAAAAVKCSRFGGRVGFPSDADVTSYLEEHEAWS
jgi:sulfofructose kinase